VSLVKRLQEQQPICSGHRTSAHDISPRRQSDAIAATQNCVTDAPLHFPSDSMNKDMTA
jgi:hypothetical protein